jgi:hypothetical protein
MISDEDLKYWIELYDKPKWDVVDRKTMPMFSKISVARDLLQARQDNATLTAQLQAAREDAERLATELESEQNIGYTCKVLEQHNALVAQEAE